MGKGEVKQASDALSAAWRELDAVVEPAEVAELPAIDPDNEKGWAAIEKSTLCDRMKQALRLVASGSGYVEASKEVGYATHSDVWRACRKYGLMNVKTKRIMGGNRRIAYLANELLEERLVETPDEISMRDLSVAGGIAQDKIAKKERWGQEEATTGVMDALGSVAAQIVKTGGRLEAKVVTDQGEATLSIGKGEPEPIDGEVVE